MEAALSYFEVFEWPLTAFEVRKFLPVLAENIEVDHTLRRLVDSGRVEEIDGLFVLAGAGGHIERRRACEDRAARLWPRARRWGWAIGKLPFVRMVAVSGSLAVDAVDEDADIDFFLIIDDGRLWSTRAAVIGLVRLASLGRPKCAVLCPNFIVAPSSMEMADHDQYTAHEIAQLVVLHGERFAAAFIEQNSWIADLFPNHPDVTSTNPARWPPMHPVRRSIERVLRCRAVDRFERWEQARKISQLIDEHGGDECRYTASVCKGHADGHRGRANALLAEQASARRSPL